MGLTEEQLTLLQEYAAALITPAEIAILLDISPSDRKSFSVRCRIHEGTQEYEAFHRGRLTTKLELRKNIIKLAKAGSPAAEPLAERFLQEQNLDK
jgi:hypothetical protein